MLEQRIQQQFFDSADLKYQAAELLARPIAEAAQAVLGCITSGGKLLVCGGGWSAGDAQRFAAQLVDRFERERPGLPAIALGADAAQQALASENAEAAVQACAKQVHALGNPGDLLVAISTHGQSAAVLAAVQAAHDKDMSVVALSGHDGGALRSRLLETDVHICVPHDRAVRIQEVHGLVLHCLCDAVDLQLLGDQDTA
jgi:D-sedoheptulose 7-phosphate isomerase